MQLSEKRFQSQNGATATAETNLGEPDRPGWHKENTMSMAFNNARNQYLKTQVETASKEQLVLMLFDGILRFTEQARKALRENAIEEGHNALMRAEAIVMELIVTVDKEKGGEIATNLIGLHAYAYNALVQCNLHKDESKIDEVQNIYRKLREGWVGAMASLGIGPHAQQQAAAPKTLPTGNAPTPAPKTSGTLPNNPAQGSGGIMAGAKTPAVAASLPAQPVAPVAQPAAAAAKPAAGTYGMGRTAMMGAYARPATPVAGSVQTPVKPNQAAMLGAYQTGTRSIA